MSVTISNCDEVCQSPLNNSKSKMLYSFPKCDRFKKTKTLLCDKYYDPLINQSARTTSFGFGQKYDLSKTSRCSPPCNTYVLKGEFERSKTQRKGFGFGKGREQMKITGPLVKCLKNKNPGPGTYQLASTLQKSSFSFTGKLQKIDKIRSNIPGPGYYPITLGINEKGEYPTSKIKNVLGRNFSTTIGRKQYLQCKGPAPGAYDISKVSLSPEGKYFLSKMQNSMVRKFGTCLRNSLVQKKQVPGPGNYKLPSDFGHYISRKFMNNEKEIKVQKTENKQNGSTLPLI